MNYDLAMMALEGLARAPLHVTTSETGVVLEADAASFKELARLCLLLGGASSTSEEFALQPGVHVTGTPLLLKLR